MREALRQVKPTVFEDLIALVALYRPGPMQYIPVYARRKAGQEPVTYIDPRLEAITGDTYGISIYQEQSMEIAKQIGGFSPADADDLRKAIGKKIHSLMASLKEQFLEGCVANGTTKEVAKQLWDDMEKAQDYSFNKSHAAGYALIAYRTAWLRAHHAHEYMAALISSVMSTKDRVPFYVNACHELGIEVLPPDVNDVAGRLRRRRGQDPLRPERGQERRRGRVPRDRRGARGGRDVRVDLGLHRARRSAGREQARARVARQVRRASTRPAPRAWGWSACSTRRSRGAARSTRRGAPARARSSTSSRPPARRSRATTRRSRSRSTSARELLRLEKETLGLWVSEHPLAEIGAELRRKTDRALADLERCRDGEIVTVGGIVSSVKALTTKKGDPMVFLRLDDLTGSAEAVVFNSVYAASRELCEADRVLILKGRVDHKEGESKLIAIEVTEFEAYVAPTEVRLKVDARKAQAGVLRELGIVVRDHPGEAKVVLALETSEGPRTLEFGPEYRVAPVPDFYAEVKALLGEAAVS